MYLFNVYLNIYLKTISCLSLTVTHLIYEAEVSYEGFLTQLYKDTWKHFVFCNIILRSRDTLKNV